MGPPVNYPNVPRTWSGNYDNPVLDESYEQPKPERGLSPVQGFPPAAAAAAAAAAADAGEQQQSRTANVFVAAFGSSSPAASPRARSRLRTATVSSSTVAQQLQNVQGLPEYVTVHRVPHEIASENEVEIEHLETDEAQRHDAVEGTIIKKVDELADFYRKREQAHMAVISELELQLKEQKTLRLDKQQLQQDYEHLQAQADSGIWGAVVRSWRVHCCRWVLLLLLLLAVLLAVVLGVTLQREPPPPAPAFAVVPQLLAATNTSLDFSLALSQAATVSYIIIPRTAASRRALQAAGSSGDVLLGVGSSEIQAAARGWGATTLEAGAAACGSFLVAGAGVNTTFSAFSITSTAECLQQRAAAEAGGRRASCERCPFLRAAVTYDVVLVAVGAEGSASDPVIVQATTLPGWAGTAPSWGSSIQNSSGSPDWSSNSSSGTSIIRGTRLPDTSHLVATALSDSSFQLTFKLGSPGSVRFLVLHATLYSRFVQQYATWDNAVTDPTGLLAVPRGAFWHGLVARGQVLVQQAETSYTCTIGGGAASTTSCACDPGTTCSQEMACFGPLCDYSTSALAPNTTYKVLLIPLSLDGTAVGQPIELPPFTTAPPAAPPVLSAATGVSPVIGPDRFTVKAMQQQQLGLMHLLVTRPNNQGSPVAPGTATPFALDVHAAAGRHLRRQLLGPAAISPNYPLLAPDPAAAGVSGSVFTPPQQLPQECDSSAAVAAFVDPSLEALVLQQCVPVAKITDTVDSMVTGLANDTVYRVLLAPTGLGGRQDVYSSLVRTQDLAPPILTVTARPPPEFDSFSVTVQLNEAGTIYAGLLLNSNATAVTATAACPPSFQGPVVQVATSPGLATAGNQDVAVSFAGLAANTDYQLRLIALDAHGNCQPQFTVEAVHTLDNVPPVTLALVAANVAGMSADLQITLDEPGLASFVVLQQTAAGVACPTADQLFAGTLPAGLVLPSPSSSGTLAVAAANTAASQTITSLASQTAYRACAVAMDSTRLQNKQAAASFVDFVTLDITPPTVLVAALPGTDGNFTCSRTDFTCSLTFSTSLSEPGAATWVLLRAPGGLAVTPVPTTQQLLASSNVASMFPGNTVAANGTLALQGAAAAANATCLTLASQASYALVLGARDAAPAANYAVLQQLVLTAPDVTPPAFTNVTLAAVADTTISLDVVVDEASFVFFVVAASPSKAPSPAQVVAGQAASGAAPAFAGRVSAAANATTSLPATGLVPGSFYDIYLLAVDDPAGNRQLAVTNISSVRTTDSLPPVIHSLVATFTSPMTFTITANVSKPGSLLYAARKLGAPPPTVQEVLSAVESSNKALANFTATLDVPAARVAATGSECVADGNQMVVYAVANDTEGRWPGRSPNTSPLVSAAVALVPLALGQSCIDSVFLAALQPRLSFSSVPQLSGFMLGSGVVSNATAAAMVWQQDVLGFAGSNLPQPTAMTALSLGAIPLPGTLPLRVANFPPAAVALIVRSAVLIPEANSPLGSTLRFTYQLRDAAGRTQVSAANLTVRPLLSYAAGSSPPAGALAADNVLPDCDASLIGPDSGVGLCEVPVDKKLFPAAGAASLGATIKARVLVGAAQVAVSATAAVTLQAPPAAAPFLPSSPGLLVTMPYRAVFAGETVTVTLQAVHPGMQGLTGAVIPLRYDRRVLEFRGVATADLWLPAVVSQRPVGGTEEIQEIALAGRAAGTPASFYRASSSIPLFEVRFAVKAATPGTFAGALTINAQPLVAASSASFLPSWSSAPFQFNSFNGKGASGALSVAGIATLGMWGWASSYDVFNTAALNSQQVSVQLFGLAVRSFGDLDVAQGEPVTCASPAAGGGAATVNAGTCQLSANAVNTVPAKALTIPVTAGTATTQVKLSVWVPSNLRLTAADTTLNSVMPINTEQTQISTSCMDMFQATPLTLTADWSNGGPDPAADRLAATDVTRLATFISSNTNVAQVSGATVKGLQPGTALISSPASPATQLAITVSSQPVCLVQLHALATTGAAWTAGSATALAASPPKPLAKVALAWQARQALQHEDSSAVVLSYAVFSDGSSMDVSGRAAVAAVLPPGASTTQLPFTLGLDAATQLQTVNINVSIGAASSCDKSLAATWSVCSIPLGSGSGTVAVRLARPTAVANFSADPVTITGPGNDAALQPIALPNAASLSLLVLFDNGAVRDFSADPRTTFTVTTGAAFCSVVAVSGGGWQVVATAQNVAGSCDVTASVAFAATPGSPLTAVKMVQVVGLTQLELYGLEANAVALPLLLPLPASQQLREALVLLKCDGRNYEQRTLWALGLLSNCSVDGSVCPRLDLSNRQYLTLSSSNTSVAQISAAYPPPLDAYPAYPWLDNRLVPFAAGTSTLVASFGNSSTTTLLTVKDTYQPAWPAAAPLSDMSALVTANMTEAFTVTFQLLTPAALAALGGLPGLPNATTIAQTGSALLPNATGGPFFYSAVAAGLAPGTNYTLVAAVSSGGTLTSPGVSVLTGLLVPDTTPPSFTASSVTSISVAAGSDAFRAAVQLGLDEPGSVWFAVYGDPSCITADPTPEEMRAGINLRDVGKCNCSSSDACAAAASGQVVLAGNASELVPISGRQPAWPFTDLPADTFCANYTPAQLALQQHSLYLLAQDDLPTYKGWTTSCSMPPADQAAPPGPCAPLTLGSCANTPAPDALNQQQPPFAGYDVSATPGKPAPPPGQPLRGVVNISDGVAPGFVAASAFAVTATPGGNQPGVSFSFQTSKPGLVRWWLVEDVTTKVAHGWFPVRDATRAASLTIALKCMGTPGPLLTGAAYALWYQMLDIYGTWSELQIMDVKWQ